MFVELVFISTNIESLASVYISTDKFFTSLECSSVKICNFEWTTASRPKHKQLN